MKKIVRKFPERVIGKFNWMRREKEKILEE